MTIESFIISALSEALEVPVSGNRPTPMPERFVTVEQTGSRERDHVRQATIVVESWAENREASAELNELAKAAMLALPALPEISSAACETDSNYPDLTTRKPRYRALFNVVYFL